MSLTKELLILEMKRSIEILEKNEKFDVWTKDSGELRNKLKEIRRDSIRLEKEVWQPWNHRQE